MAYGDAELIRPTCPACGCAEVFTAVAEPGEREMPVAPSVSAGAVKTSLGWL